MQIVIDIPNEEVPNKQEIIDISLHFIAGEVCECNYPYIVLPKGHGRLKDTDAICKDIISALGIRDENYLLEAEEAVYKRIKNAQTIIEADGGDAE